MKVKSRLRCAEKRAETQKAHADCIPSHSGAPRRICPDQELGVFLHARLIARKLALKQTAEDRFVLGGSDRMLVLAWLLHRKLQNHPTRGLDLAGLMVTFADMRTPVGGEWK